MHDRTLDAAGAVQCAATATPRLAHGALPVLMSGSTF